jgi:transcription elongation GreA/GreB family factor
MASNPSKEVRKRREVKDHRRSPVPPILPPRLHPSAEPPKLGRLNKQILIDEIIATLERELEGTMQSARDARSGATDEQNKAENKYDTRGLEASYLADGQSRQALETMQSIQLFRNLPLRDFSANDAIELGALVELEHGRETTAYFIGPRSGGTEVEMDGHTIIVLTPQSPLGQQLNGKREGDTFQMAGDRRREIYRITRVL